MGLLFLLGGSGTGGVSVWPISSLWRRRDSVLLNTVAKIPLKILKNDGTNPNQPGLTICNQRNPAPLTEGSKHDQ